MTMGQQPHGDPMEAAVRQERPHATPRGPVWVRCDPTLPHVGLRRALREVPNYQGLSPQPGGAPSLAICCPEADDEVVARAVAELSEAALGAPVVVFGEAANLPLARASLRAGARGFLHARMPSEHVSRALRLAEEGEVVLPKALINCIADEARGPDISALTARQEQILELVSEGLSNAQVAGRLYVSESTVKQHLRGAYKVLGARNRVEAAATFRRHQARMAWQRA